MRRRWRWPLAEFVRHADAEEWMTMGFIWLFGWGALTMITVAIWHPASSEVAGSVPFWMALALAAPYVLAILSGLIALARKFVPLLIPRRVTEPIIEDLRAREKP